MSVNISKLMGYAATAVGPFVGGTVQLLGPSNTANATVTSYAADSWSNFCFNAVTTRVNTTYNHTEWGINQDSNTPQTALGTFFGPPRANQNRNRLSPNATASTSRSNFFSAQTGYGASIASMPFYRGNWGFSIPPGNYTVSVRVPANINSTANIYMFFKMLAWDSSSGVWKPTYKSPLLLPRSNPATYDSRGLLFTFPLFLPASWALTSGSQGQTGYVELLPLVWFDAARVLQQAIDDFVWFSAYTTSTRSLTRTYVEISFLQTKRL